VLRHDRDGELPRELLHQPVALVEQIVRRLAGAVPRRDDLVVHVGDGARELVDPGDGVADAARHLLLEGVELRLERAEALHEAVGLAQQGLARGRRGRVVGDVLHGIEERLQPGVESRLRAGEEVVEAPRQRVERRETRLPGERGAELPGGELVEYPLDGGDVGSAADVTVAEALAMARRELGHLAAVAGRVRVRDVVAGHLDRAPEREHPGQADVQQVRHGARSPRRAYRPEAGKVECRTAFSSTPLSSTDAIFSAYAGSVAYPACCSACAKPAASSPRSRTCR